MQMEPLLEEGVELYMRIAKTTTAQQLAENATNKTTRSWDKIVPPQYHQHTHIFSNEATQWFPESREWDHAIELKPNAPGSLDCKIYPLTPTKDIEMQKFIDKNLPSRKICRSKSRYMSPFFFIKKKSGELHPV